MFIDIKPVPKPRMTMSDRWAKRPAVIRYRTYCDELRLKYTKRLPAILSVDFYMPIPNSFSRKKKALYIGKPHQQRPDIDNLLKAVMDALCDDDSYIYIIHAAKQWSDRPGIEIYEEEPLERLQTPI